MIFEYIIKTSDGSFDYLAPWGTETHNCVDIHGFDFDPDEGLKTFNGFGDYSYLDSLKGNVHKLIEELDLILLTDYDEEDESVTSPEVFEELMEILREIALKEEMAA